MKNEHMKIANHGLIRIAIVMLFMLIIGWQASSQIIDYFLSLSTFKVMTITPFEMIQTRFSISVVFALCMAIPYMYIESYKFVSPALYKNELKIIRWSSIPFFVMFIIGNIFALKVFLPIVMVYVNKFYISTVINSVTLNNYVSFLISSMLLFGVVFCVPVVLSILSYVGVINHKVMKTYRKHVFIALLLVGAIITPPDVFTQILVSLPLMVLYESSIFISWIMSIKSNQINEVVINE